MRTRSFKAALLLSVVAGAAASKSNAQTVFYFENFDSAVRDSVSGDPRTVAACAGNTPSFTHNPPAGWLWSACGVPSYECRTGLCPPVSDCSTCTNNEGVLEWEGWSFANKNFWVQVAGDQTRSQFALGTGNVAVADPDEWDDRGDPDFNCGYYSTFMTTPAISLASATPGSLSFTFASSWRPEAFDDSRRIDLEQDPPQAPSNNQTATIRAIYTVGGVDQPPIEILRWESDSASAFFKPDSQNEQVVLTDSQLQAPVGATAVKFEFGLSNAGNDWWWAIDNLVLAGDVGGSPADLFTEGFEGVTLELPVHEIPSGCGTAYCGELVYTHTGPNGVVVTLDPAVSGGVPDWAGWSFVERPFWFCMSGGPNGRDFTNSSGLLAVADGDEFDDLANDPGPLDTTLATPAINIGARTGDVIVLSFDSSWRWENPQFATVTAEYDVGGSVEVLRWESDPLSPFFKGDAVNELVAVPLVVPAGATNVTLKFRYSGFNNWWWAIDNVRVFEGEAEIVVASNTPNTGVMTLAPTIDYPACFTPWSPDGPAGWSDIFLPNGACPTECGREEWRGWAFANKDWWWQKVDNQERDQFTKGRGFIAIADPDEWDDQENGRSEFNAFLTSPNIPITGPVVSASLNFDSSWRPEGFDDSCSCNPNPADRINNQTATINAIYTVGGVEQPPVEILRWDSDPNGSFYKDDRPEHRNESVSLALTPPVGATAVKFEYGLTKARNDWWWAVDNLEVRINGNLAFSENFSNPTNLRVPPTELPPEQQCFYFSSLADQGANFTQDNSGLTGNCVTDFTGFNAWLVDAWATAGGGARQQYGAETAYVSDFAQSGCGGTARMLTADYGISAVNAGTLELEFRSSWGSDAAHVSTIEVAYDAGQTPTWIPVLNWNTGNKSTTPDEIVTVALNNPEGAQRVRFRFSDSESGWWAISQLRVTGIVGVAACPADFNGDGFLDFFDFDDFVVCFEGGVCPPGKSADFNGDNFVDFFDYDDFAIAFEAGC